MFQRTQMAATLQCGFGDLDIVRTSLLRNKQNATTKPVLFWIGDIVKPSWKCFHCSIHSAPKASREWLWDQVVCWHLIELLAVRPKSSSGENTWLWNQIGACAGVAAQAAIIYELKIDGQPFLTWWIWVYIPNNFRMVAAENFAGSSSPSTCQRPCPRRPRCCPFTVFCVSSVAWQFWLVMRWPMN